MLAFDAVVDEDPRHFGPGLALGELELGVLEIEHALPERLTLLDVFGRHFDGFLHRNHAGDRDDEALARQLGHQLAEALALGGAEQIVGGDPDVVKEQLRGVLRVEPDLVERLAAAEALDLIGFDDEQRDALAARFRIGLRDDDDEIGDLAVRDEGLGAVDPIAVAVLQCRGADRLQVRSGARLAHGDRRDALARAELRQPSPSLFLGAVGEDIGQDDDVVQRQRETLDAVAADLLDQHDVMTEVTARAAIFDRDRDAEQPRFARLPPEGALDLPGLAPLRDALGRGFALEEACGAVGEGDQFGVSAPVAHRGAIRIAPSSRTSSPLKYGLRSISSARLA